MEMCQASDYLHSDFEIKEAGQIGRSLRIRVRVYEPHLTVRLMSIFSENGTGADPNGGPEV